MRNGLKFGALRARTFNEVIEVDVWQALAQPGEVTQVFPEHDLVFDRHDQEIKLLKAAERRALPQAPVELGPSEAFAGDCQSDLR